MELHWYACKNWCIMYIYIYYDAHIYEDIWIYVNAYAFCVIVCASVCMYKHVVNIPEQVIKSSPNWKPVLHSQTKLPSVFVHISLQPLKETLRHSSVQKKEIILVFVCANVYVSGVINFENTWLRSLNKIIHFK